MNWTGGSLQRTKHANKGVVQKQKAFFARARTQLQNGSCPSVMPFRPSYFRDVDDRDLGGQVPVFGSGSVHRTGHPAGQLHEEVKFKTSSRNKRHYDEDGKRYQATSKHASRRAVPVQGLPAGDLGEKHHERRKADDENIETKLLEANRERLLRQQDWIGFAPSQAVDLRFSSSKDNERIGKRRKVDGRCGAAAHRHNDLKLADRSLQPANDDYALMSGALRNDDADIRIRIGTDTLTTAYSTQPDDCVQSQASSDPMLFEQASSDPMLFDHEPHSAAQQEESRDAKDVLFIPLTLVEGSCLNIDHNPQRPDEQPRLFLGEVWRRKINPSQKPEMEYSGKHNRAEQATAGFYVGAVGRMDIESEASAPGYQITHYAKGIERPLRLIFRNSSPSADTRSRIKSQDDNVGEGDYAQKVGSADSSRLGCMHQVNNENEQQIVEEALTITDGDPWKPYITFSDEGSSLSTAARLFETRSLHPHPTARNNKVGAVNWSQHAEQENSTHVSSISASPPSLRRPGEKSHARQTVLCNMDEEEKVWQSFVFGSVDDFGSETMSEHDGCSDQKMSKAVRGSSHISLLVSSASVPFRSESRMDACISDNVHDTAATSAPPLGFRSITPRFHRSDEETGEGEYSMASGEQSVNHASLQNNASCDTDPLSSRMFSDTGRLHNSLSRSDYFSDRLSRQATAGRSEVGRLEHSSSIYGTPASSDNALDLVDPNSLT